MTTLLVVVFIGIIIIGAWGKNQKNERLKQDYDDALKGGNKKKALDAGREYYSAMRGNKLTVYDESAITNDLISMESISPAPRRMIEVGDIMVSKHSQTLGTFKVLEIDVAKGTCACVWTIYGREKTVPEIRIEDLRHKQ